MSNLLPLFNWNISFSGNALFHFFWIQPVQTADCRLCWLLYICFHSFISKKNQKIDINVWDYCKVIVPLRETDTHVSRIFQLAEKKWYNKKPEASQTLLTMYVTVEQNKLLLLLSLWLHLRLTFSVVHGQCCYLHYEAGRYW